VKVLTDREAFTGPRGSPGYAERARRWREGYRPPLEDWQRNLRAIRAAEDAGQPLPLDQQVRLLLSGGSPPNPRR
jgi:hypothetical protein